MAMKAKKWARVCAVLTPLALVGTILYGCSSDRPSAGSSGDVVPPGESCTTEGAVSACHDLVGFQSGVRLCSHGQRVCTGGKWSACGAFGETTVEATNFGMGLDNLGPAPSAGDIKTMALTALADAAACANPCNPDCRGYDFDAGLLSNDASSDVQAIQPLESTPPGFEAKLLGSGGSPAHCEWYGSPAAFTSQNGWVASSCQADFFCKKHCNQPAGCPGGNDMKCVKFSESTADTHALQQPRGAAMTCRNALPDLTIASPCTLAGKTTVAICNRGAGPVAAGKTITMSVEAPGGTIPYINNTVVNPAALETMAGCRTAPSDCSMTLTAPLNPGQCVRMAEGVHCGAGVNFNGNKLAQVNSDRSIQECAFQTHYDDALNPRGEHGVIGTTFVPHNAGEAPLQQGCSNNFSAWNNSQLPLCPQPFEQKVTNFSFSAVCPTGTRPQWGRLGWKSSIPALTEILFEVRVRDNPQPDGGASPWSPWVLAGRARVGQDPANCTMTGTPNGVVGSGICPKDLFVFLNGLPQARHPNLELRITHNPLPFVAPILYDFFLAYSCPAAE